MKKESISIDTEFIRLDALLKRGGAVDTGGQAKFEIQAGERAGERRAVHHAREKMRPGDQAVYNNVCYEVCSSENTESGV